MFHSLSDIVLNQSKSGGSNTKPWNSIKLSLVYAKKPSYHGGDAPTINPNTCCGPFRQNHKIRFVLSLVRPLDDGRGPLHFHSNGSCAYV
jgi:hypothetical protein